MTNDDLKRRLESLLFSSGRKLETEELAKHCKEENIATIKQTLKELQKELDEKKSSLMLIEEGNAWKLTVREQYIQYVKKVVKQPELPKSLLETLAIVAFKAPALQSQIIKIRTNKAYRHLDELEKNGYITREKKGRTKLIKLTQKFFDYFDLPVEKLKEKFKNIAKLEKAIETKEEQIQECQTIETTPAPQPVEIVQEKLGKLEVYDTTPTNGEELKKLGELEVYTTEHKKKHKKKKKEETAEEETKIEEEKELLESKPEWVEEEPKEEIVENKEEKPSKGMFPEGMPTDVEKKVDEIVKEIVEPKEEGEKNE